jgi:hypothetical protein
MITDFWQLGHLKAKFLFTAFREISPRGFLAGFREFFPPLANLVGMAENEQSTKKVGIDIL